jgi:hypothetical protein
MRISAGNKGSMFVHVKDVEGRGSGGGDDGSGDSSGGSSGGGGGSTTSLAIAKTEESSTD